MPGEERNLFAIIRGRSTRVCRIAVTQDLQRELGTLFTRATQGLVGGNPEHIEFDGHYKPDDEEILYIDDFQLPDEVVGALAEPTTCQPLRLSIGQVPEIKALFTGQPDASVVQFQAFERNQVLGGRGVSAVVSAGTYRRLTEPGIIINPKIDALFIDGKLFFSSFSQAKRVLNLGEYYREATSTEVGKFAQLPALRISDVVRFTQQADSWVRRRIATILDDGFLTPERLPEIRQIADDHHVTLPIEDQNGAMVLVLPDEKREMKELIRFLAEEVYKGPLSGRPYITNSRRPFVPRS